MKTDEETNYRFNLKEKKATIKTVSKIFSILLLATTFYLISTLLILQIYSNFATDKSNFYFYEKSPDLIAVFTGDRGRLDQAFKILEHYPESKLLISGVYNKNTLKSLIAAKKVNLTEEQISQVVEIDYLSRNTFENVLATIQELKKNKTMKNVLIVSSDYHLLRINLLFYILNDENASLQIHYIGVKSQSNILSKILECGSEGLKIIKTLVISVFLDREETR